MVSQVLASIFAGFVALFGVHTTSPVQTPILDTPAHNPASMQESGSSHAYMVASTSSTTTNTIVIERTVQVASPVSGGVSQNQVTDLLSSFQRNISSIVDQKISAANISHIPVPEYVAAAGAGAANIGGYIAGASQNISQLVNTLLTNPTITGGSISGASVGATSLSSNVSSTGSTTADILLVNGTTTIQGPLLANQGATISNTLFLDYSYASYGQLAYPFVGTPQAQFGIGNSLQSTPVDGSFAGISFSALNSSGFNQIGYLGAVSIAGGTNRTPDIVIGSRFGNTSIERFRIVGASGSIGIGTSSPASFMELFGNSNAVLSTAINSPATLSITNKSTTNNSYGALAFRTQDLTNGSATSTAQIAAVATSHTTGAVSGELSFGTINAGLFSEKLRITAAGNVGVGTTTPGSNFAIQALYSNTGNNIFTVASSTNSTGSLMTNLFTVASSGNVGVGTTTPDAYINIYGTGLTNNALLHINAVGVGAGQAGAFYGGKFDVVANNNATASYGVYANVGTAGASLSPHYGIYGAAAVTSSNQFSYGLYGLATYNSAASNAYGAGIFADATTTGTSFVGKTYGAYINNSTQYAGTAYGAFVNATSGPTTVIPFAVAMTGTEVFRVASSGNVGVGTTTPGANLAIQNVYGSTNATLFAVASSTNTTGTTASTFFRVDSAGLVGVASSTPWAQLSINPSGLSGPVFAIGSSTKTLLLVTNGGNVGIGTSSPSTFKLQVAGHIGPDANNTYNLGASGSNFGCLYYNGGTLGVCASDARLKTNIQGLSFDNPLQQVIGLQPRSFAYLNSPSTIYHGLIAQEVEQVAPELVDTDASTSYKEVRYGDIQWLLLAGVQEIAHVSGAFKDNLVAWFGNSANGIADLFAHDVYATNVSADSVTAHQKLCIGNTCVTEDQLKALLAAAGQTSVSPNDQSPGSVSPIGLIVNGNNPATLELNAHYSDLGATITGSAQDLNLGISAQIDGSTTTTIPEISIDTSVPGTHTISYTVSAPDGRSATAERTVIVSDPNQTTSSTTPSSSN